MLNVKIKEQSNVFFNVIHHDTAPAYTSLSVQRCLAVKQNCGPPPSILARLVPCDFFLVLEDKVSMMAFFQNVPEI